jgi:two-component system, LytTR family, response regulator
MSIRSLIVDDEPLARHSIQRFLKYHPDIEIVEECGDGQTAVNAILANQPDLVFLDVQMPELDALAEGPPHTTHPLDWRNLHT